MLQTLLSEGAELVRGFAIPALAPSALEAVAPSKPSYRRSCPAVETFYCQNVKSCQNISIVETILMPKQSRSIVKPVETVQPLKQCDHLPVKSGSVAWPEPLLALR